MATPPAAFCPQCGTPMQGNSRFCTNCGATVELNANNPTQAAAYPLTPPASGASAGSWPAAEVPPPPPPSSMPTSMPGSTIYAGGNQAAPPPPPTIFNPYTSAPAGPPSYAQTTLANSYTPPPVAAPQGPMPMQAGAYQVPDYAKKQKGNHSCLIITIVLLLILALGGVGGFLLLRNLANHSTASNGNNTSGSSAQNTPGSSGSSGQSQTPTPKVSSPVPLNLQFTYSSITITLVSAQTASSFTDDTSTNPGSAGVLRLNVRENNATPHNPNYLESEAMLLVLPGGTTVQLGNAQTPISPDTGVNRQNWLDFPLNNQVALNQLTLRVGTQSQAQFDIPLQANADLSKYQDRTSNPGTQFKYGALNMTLKTVTLSYSYVGQQATTGNRYLILTLSEVNNTSNSFDLYAPNEMRLQVAGNTIEPEDTYTLPYTVNGNSTASGIVAFTVPQSATTFTLILLAQSSATPPASQVTQAIPAP